MKAETRRRKQQETDRRHAEIEHNRRQAEAALEQQKKWGSRADRAAG